MLCINLLGSERQSFLVEYPVSYMKHWKTDGVATTQTANSNQYNTKVTSVSKCIPNVNSLQHYSNTTKFHDPARATMTNGEVKHSNHDQTRTNLANSNDEAKFQNTKKNRWDLKDKDMGKSLLRDKTKLVKTFKSDCKVELVDYMKEYSNNNTEKCLKTEKQLENNNHCNVKSNVDSNKEESSQCSGNPGHSWSERPSKSQMLTNRCKGSNNSEKMEDDNQYESENTSSEESVDELDNKDPQELLMSMNNRSIKISRLLAEQKRLMANLHAVKHTPW